MDVRGGKASASAGDSDGEGGKRRGARPVYIGRKREAEAWRTRGRNDAASIFDATIHKASEEKGAFISELAFPHHLAAVGRTVGLIHSRFYTSEKEQRPGPTPMRVL